MLLQAVLIVSYRCERQAPKLTTHAAVDCWLPAVAEAVAAATAEAFAAAASNCAEAETAAKAVDTKKAIATAIAETSASACSTGGTATATSEAVTQAVAKATATAYVDVLAAVSGPCGGCGAAKPAQDNKPKVQDQPKVQEKKPDTAAQSEQPKATPHNHSDEDSKHAGGDAGSVAGQLDSPLDVTDAPTTTASDDSSYRSRQQRKYKACYTWLKDDCCSGWKGSSQCHCFSFGMR